MLFLVGGVQMIVAEVVVAALLGHYFTASANWVVPNDVGLAVLIIICIFVSGFAYRCRFLLAPGITSASLPVPSLLTFAWVHPQAHGRLGL